MNVRPAPPAGYDPLSAETDYPLQRALGFRVAAWSEGYARVEMPVREVHRNRYGIPHGGVHATLMDTAAGFSGCWCPWPGRVRRAMTLSLAVSYVGPLTGTMMIAEARVSGGGRRSFFSTVELRDENGALLATAQTAMRYRANGGDPMGDPVEDAG